MTYKIVFAMILTGAGGSLEYQKKKWFKLFASKECELIFELDPHQGINSKTTTG